MGDTLGIDTPYITQEIVDKIYEIFTNKRDRYYSICLIGFMCNIYVLLRKQRNFKFSISKRFWARVFGAARFNSVIYPLKHKGILICDEKFKVGIKCKEYSLAPEFRNGNFFLMENFEDLIKNKKGEIPYGKTFFKKLYEEVEKNRENRPAEFKELQSMYIKLMSKLKLNEAVEKEFMFREKFMTQDQKDRARVSINMFNQKRFHSNSHLLTSRQFHNISNMPKIVRKYLELDGKQLIEVDLQQSHPFLLLSFYDDTPEELVEKSRYARFLKDHRIYDYYNQKCRRPIPNTPENQKRIKQQFLTPFFAPSKVHNSEICQLFFNDFPKLGAKIEKIKYSNYKEFALRLQKAEAYLFVERIFRRCYQENLFAITNHDSLLILSENQDKISEIIVSECRAIIEFEPKIKIKSEQT